MPVGGEGDPPLVCEGCETPHHKDCYEENGGCTVFGCRCAPPDEPKVHVSRPELSGVGMMPPRTSATTATVTTPPPGSILGLSGPSATTATLASRPRVPTPTLPIPQSHKKKMTFVVLGVILGALGAHNFYAGYKKKALCQLGLTVLTIGYGAAMSWIWAIIDICTVECDSNGVQFSS